VTGVPDEGLERLVTAARARGWREAIEAEWPPASPLHRYAGDPREGDALHLLPDGRRRRALFLGNALAILPCLLAAGFESVVVADRDPRRVAFARHRRDEDALGNLTCVVADDLGDLGWSEHDIDLVVLGEDHPDATTSLPFTDARTPFRVASLLAPDGWLMYGVRFRLLDSLAAYVAGPRVARLMSYPAHLRVLRRASLATVHAYWRRPDSRPYTVHVPIDRRAVVTYWLAHAPRPRHWRGRMSHRLNEAAHRLASLPHVVDNFLLIAGRG
jgi:hypothetical protein